MAGVYFGYITPWIVYTNTNISRNKGNAKCLSKRFILGIIKGVNRIIS